MAADPSTPRMLHVDAIQTAPPGKVTAPGQARRISTAAPLGPEVLQSRFQAVWYYTKAGEESPLAIAAWIKESLSAALPGHPVLSGRLRRDDGWEVKFNDSGVRLVQATAETTMSEFLASEDRNGREAHLAYWEDVDVQSPNFSALFYIQVTQFRGDGYSIGISCSLLLADPLFLTRFLNSWAQTHTQMRLSKSPMFHLSYFQRPDRSRHLKSVELESSPVHSPSSTTTMLFKGDRDAITRSYGQLAVACLREATRRLHVEAAPGFCLLISDHGGELRVEPRANPSQGSSAEALDVVWWDQLGVEELILVQGSKPVHVSCRIVSSGDGRLVVVMIPPDAEGDPKVVVSVTLPDD
ncbi:Transferase family [Musa troglodytarum]|uniref:Transferase family n=1 Tax=Musa troglodytarum TaxID=320322 RepID=A0A9E7K197_9LILI|nr:Transferase family [Musa troglodytarum]